MKQLHLQSLILLGLTTSSASPIRRMAISAINHKTIYNILKKSQYVDVLSGKLFLTEEGKKKVALAVSGKVNFEYEVSTIGRLMSMLDACLKYILSANLVIYKGTTLYKLLEKVKAATTSLLDDAVESVPSQDSDTKEVATIAALT